MVYKTYLDRARDLDTEAVPDTVEANHQEISALCLIDIAMSLREVKDALSSIAGSLQEAKIY